MIDSLTATPSSVPPGATVTVAVSAHDPDCTTGTCTTGCNLYIRADLTAWTATGGSFISVANGTSGSPYSASAVWQAPEVEGNYTITVTLADSGSSFCALGARNYAPASVTVPVTTVTGGPPVVDSLTAEPGQILPGATSALACAATDPDGDPVSYLWSADGGQLTPGAGGEATFTSGEPGLFSVTCTAADSFGLEGSDSIQVAVAAALVEGSVSAGLTTPLRVAVNAAGELFVIDRGAGAIAVVDLHTARAVYSLPRAGATSVAVDWAGRLLVGEAGGARVLDALGAPVLELANDGALGAVADVAVDPAARRYAVLHPQLARVAVYDEAGLPVLGFGSTGDGAGQMRGPRGLAFGPDGSLVVADTGHGLIHVFSPAGQLLRSFGGQGGGAGKFVRLDDVEVDAGGRVYASDSFQDWVQVYDAQGVARDTLGTYGDEPGQLRTASGLAISNEFARLVVASSNGSRLELFRTSEASSPAPPVASPALAPSSLAFAPIAVGEASAPQTATLSNVGGSRLGITGVSLTGDFEQSNDCGPVLDEGASCTLTVSFRPSAAGARAGSVLVETSGEPMRVGLALAGEAFAAASAVRLEPTALVFAPQAVGTSSDPQNVQMTNVGSAPLNLAGITASGEFAVSTLCPALLPAGAGCPIAVRYAPMTVADPAVGALLVASDAAGSPHTASLAGSSTAAVPSVSIADWEGDEVGAGESAVASFAVTLSRATSVPVSVAWSTVDASAAAGEDYEGAAGELVFAAGETERTIEVSVLGDDLLERDEELFRVTLEAAVGAALDDASADGAIRDDELCLSENLLFNAGAEAKPAADGALPGWSAAVGSPWRRQAAPPAPVEGTYTFYSASNAYGELVQDVDVTAFAAAIDAGSQIFRFEASVRTLYEVTPSARVIVEYRDLDNLAPLEVADSGPIMSPAGWTRLEDERPAPAGTGWIRVRLINLAPGVAYFDALALRSLRAASVVVADVRLDEGDGGFREALFPVRLACPYYEPVALDYATREGTAREGEDYLASVGTLELAAGETASSIPVEIVGDLTDEEHESLALELVLGAGSPAVLVDGDATGEIRNDDFCALTAEGWLADPAAWPADRLELGGVEYGRDELVELLGYQGPDGSHRLARELAAAKLNYERGAGSEIEPALAAADRCLELYPPGSSPKGKQKQRCDELEHQLTEYNQRGCA